MGLAFSCERGTPVQAASHTLTRVLQAPQPPPLCQGGGCGGPRVWASNHERGTPVQSASHTLARVLEAPETPQLYIFRLLVDTLQAPSPFLQS